MLVEAQRRLTWKLVDTKLEKGNWSMSGGRLRLGRAGTSGGRHSVMLPVSMAWWSGKEHKRQPRTLKTAALPVRLPATMDRVPAGEWLRERGRWGQPSSIRDLSLHQEDSPSALSSRAASWAGISKRPKSWWSKPMIRN